MPCRVSYARAVSVTSCSLHNPPKQYGTMQVTQNECASAPSSITYWPNDIGQVTFLLILSLSFLACKMQSYCISEGPKVGRFPLYPKHPKHRSFPHPHRGRPLLPPHSPSPTGLPSVPSYPVPLPGIRNSGDETGLGRAISLSCLPWPGLLFSMTKTLVLSPVSTRGS